MIFSEADVAKADRMVKKAGPVPLTQPLSRNSYIPGGSLTDSTRFMPGDQIMQNPMLHNTWDNAWNWFNPRASVPGSRGAAQAPQQVMGNSSVSGQGGPYSPGGFFRSFGNDLMANPVVAPGMSMVRSFVPGLSAGPSGLGNLARGAAWAVPGMWSPEARNLSRQYFSSNSLNAPYQRAREAAKGREGSLGTWFGERFPNLNRAIFTPGDYVRQTFPSGKVSL